jgi:hypothetical protein
MFVDIGPAVLSITLKQSHLYFVSYEMGQRSLKHDIMDTYFQTFPLVLLRERSGNSTCKACKSSIEWEIDPFLFDAYLGLNGRLVLLNLLSNSPSRRQCNPCPLDVH